MLGNLQGLASTGQPLQLQVQHKKTTTKSHVSERSHFRFEEFCRLENVPPFQKVLEFAWLKTRPANLTISHLVTIAHAYPRLIQPKPDFQVEYQPLAAYLASRTLHVRPAASLFKIFV